MDHETKPAYNFNIVASTGSGSNLLSTTLPVTVSVTDANDTAPVFTSGNKETATLEENREILNTEVVYTAAATPDVAGDAVTYDLVESGDHAHFNINTTTGEVTFKETTTFNYEETPKFDITIEAKVGDQTATKDVTINLTNVADGPPVITSPDTGDALVEEEEVAANTVVYQATAKGDLDTAFVWSIIQLSDDDSDKFEIDATTGAVTFKTAETPNFEAQESYQFMIAATSTINGKTYADTQTITLAITNINDVAPIITSSSNGIIRDGDVFGTTDTVYKATGTYDADPISWSLKTGVGDAALFNIDATTGVVTFKSGTTIDEDSHTDFDFTLVATSGSLPAVEKAVTLDIRASVIPIPDTEKKDANPDASNTITGTAATELIQGGDNRDTITTGGGGDTVIGGYGYDVITLGAGSDTVVMRFNSDGDANGNWRMNDGGDTIHNFKRGEDKLVFVDMVDKTGASPITSFSEWLADDNRPDVSLVFSSAIDENGNLGITAVRFNFGETGGNTGPTSGGGNSSLVVVNFDPDGGYYNLTSENYNALVKNNDVLLSDAGMALLTDILGGSDSHESFHVIDDADLPSVLTIL